MVSFKKDEHDQAKFDYKSHDYLTVSCQFRSIPFRLWFVNHNHDILIPVEAQFLTPSSNR